MKILQNSQDIKMFLESKGYQFESETDTECIAKLISHIRRVSHIIIIIAKLISHIRSQNPSYTFRQLVEQTISQVWNSIINLWFSSYPSSARGRFCLCL